MNDFFTKYKAPISVVLLFMLGLGVFTYSKMQTALFPDITFPKIKVIADNGQQPVGKMMVTVTRPLEEAIKRVPDLQTVRSITSQGSCEISAFMDWQANIDLSKQQIESQINQISGNLPPGTSITVEKMNPSILPVIGYSLENKNLDGIELKLLAEKTIKPFLSSVPGVAAVLVIGGKNKEYQVRLDASKISQLGLTPDQVISILSQTNFITANGYVVDYKRLYLSITDAAVDDIEDLKNVIISNNPNRVVLLKDISSIHIGEQKQYIRINANGKDVPLIAILKQPNANLIQLATDMEKRLVELEKDLPNATKLIPFYNQANFVGDSVKSITDVLWIGLLLAIVVAIIFLRSFKASAVILLTIPITLGLTIVVLNQFGYTLNIMTLGAIAAAIGLIIDDSIVVVEQIHRTHEEHPGVPTRELIGRSIHYLFPAMLGSSLSTIVIFIPFVIMSGVAGAYFGILTNTMIITLICSFLVSWIGLPVIYLLFSFELKNHKKSESVHEVKSQTWVDFFIHRPAISFTFMALLAVAIYFVYPRLATGFLPEMDEGSIVLDYNSPPGTSLNETNRMLSKVDEIIQNTPEVESFSRRTGTQMGFFITEPNRGDYMIQLKKNRTKTSNEVADGIRKQIEATTPGLTVDFGQVIGDMLGDLMSSVQPIEVKVFGSDIGRLHTIAGQVASVVEQVSGTADVFDGIVVAGPVMNVEPDFAKLAQYGITPINFLQQMQLKTDGLVVGSILKENMQTDIRLLPSFEVGESVEQLRNSNIIVNGGQQVPIHQFAKVVLIEGETEIERENLQSMVPVTARLNNRDLGSVMNDIKAQVKSIVVLPQGYSIEYGGAYAEQQQSFRELLMILGIASILVFTVILFLFRDVRAALIILVIAILGVSGSFLGLYLTGTPLNVGSYTGIIMIIGIIGENSIFTFLQFRNSQGDMGKSSALVYSISTRLRPKLMTALGAIIALMPLALGIGTGAQMHQPLAIAVIGGFIAALPLLLIVLPSLLMVFLKEENKN
ncbi:efflux RND transporter permease subunit [Ekhidna sp.]|uniref:efflux RND transporter permease subunit n=1 Tax=Ekhidna sp. TaxID=2608089 RepID=UPI0032EDBD5A